MIDTNSQGPDPKRLLLAVAVSSALLMTYSYFFPPEPVNMASEQNPSPVKVKEIKEKIPVNLAAGENNADREVFALATDKDLPEQSFEFFLAEPKRTLPKRSSYRAQISTKGGSLKQVALTDFTHEKTLFDIEQGSTGLMLGAIDSSMAQAPFELVQKNETMAQLRHISDDGLSITRTYKFFPDGKIKEEILWKNLSEIPLKNEIVLMAQKSSLGDLEPGIMNPGVQADSIAVHSGGKYEKIPYKDLEKPKSFSDFSYVAFDDQFFLSAFVAKDGEILDKLELAFEKKEDVKISYAKFNLKSFILMKGEEKSFSYEIFLGPKQVELLAAQNPPLDENIDFGWFGVLSRPMLWLLVQIFAVVKNYGIAIILITFLIKLLTYPLTAKSFSSQQSMKVLQPKIKELQQKYSHDRTLLGQKQMELYRQHGINPVAGCLPMLIQLPIWFAFFQMLRSSVELFEQPFYGWIYDLTKPDQFYVLPVLMGLSMLVQQIFTPPPAEQPQMKYVMWAMPIFLTFIMLNMPSGLSLYILTNNLLTIFQQIIIKKRSSEMSLQN